MTLEEVKVISKHLMLVFGGEAAKLLPTVGEQRALEPVTLEKIRKQLAEVQIERSLVDETWPPAHPPYCGSSPKIC